jgi:hypothetical protein
VVIAVSGDPLDLGEVPLLVAQWAHGPMQYVICHMSYVGLIGSCHMSYVV